MKPFKTYNEEKFVIPTNEKYNRTWFGLQGSGGLLGGVYGRELIIRPMK